MLNLNNDMDDLIRQAADEYPLKTNGSDWDKVFSGMQSAAQVPPANNKKYWWLLLLLLPLVIAIPLFNKYNDVKRPAGYSNIKATDAALPTQSLNALTNKAKTPAEQATTSKAAASSKKDGSEQRKATSPQENHLITTTITNNLNSTSAIDINRKSEGNHLKTNNAGIDNNITPNSKPAPLCPPNSCP